MANLLWIQALCCGGETVSLLNSDHPNLRAALRAPDMTVLWHRYLCDRGRGKIRNGQIITPTGRDHPPRDAADCPGPVEMALVGATVPDPDRPAAISHGVKSSAPCLFCSAHCARP